MRKSFLLFLLAFLTLSLAAQKVKEGMIYGNAPFAKGKEVRLVICNDLLNYTFETIASETIDKNGNFKLKYKVFSPTLSQLIIQTSKAEFFLEPEKEYHLDITMDKESFQLVYPEIYGQYLQVTAIGQDSNELNYKINRFSYFFEDITQEYYPYFTYLKDIHRYDTMVSILHKNFDIKYSSTDFYTAYLYYTFASLEQSMFEKYPDTIYHKYLDNEYLMYGNPAYMDFFNTFYDNYLYTSKHISKNTLTETINDNPNYLNLFNEVGKDPLLQNERIRELVIIKNLGQFYSHPDFDKGHIIKLLDYIYTNTHFPDHKIIIQNLINKLQQFQVGKDIAKVALKEVSGADFKLNKPSGKWTYIQFFNSSCEDCIREMMILKELQQKYADSLQIVSISVDFNFSKFSQFRQTYDNKLFDWKFVHFNNNYDWLEQLQLISLPEYLILSPDGKLYKRYAATPDKGAALYFKRKFTPKEIEINPLERKNPE
ncbi:MAG: TlpA family protein disulfide reductase [Bacteroidales bacterium]|nr:TlpA family protein disulfide reductase [Bacteroidales bacterium]